VLLLLLLSFRVRNHLLTLQTLPAAQNRCRRLCRLLHLLLLQQHLHQPQSEAAVLRQQHWQQLLGHLTAG
jgi:hypothetical protein